MRLKLTLLPETYAVARLMPSEAISVGTNGFFSVTRTADELSVVCEESQVPDDAEKLDAGWRCFQLAGPIPFTTTGVVAALTEPLAAKQIGVFVVSTYDTDYILIKAEQAQAAIAAWRASGCEVADSR